METSEKQKNKALIKNNHRCQICNDYNNLIVDGSNVYCKKCFENKIENKIDKNTLTTLQNKYLNNRNDLNLNNLYNGLIYFTTTIFYKIKNKKKYYIPETIKEDIINNITTDIIKKYITKPDYKINNFFSYIYRAITNKIIDFFYSKQETDIDFYKDYLTSNNNIEQEYLIKETEREIKKFIYNTFIYYSFNDDNLLDKLLYHYHKIENRNKVFESYLYKIKDKKTRDTFYNAMMEIKAYLKKQPI